MALMLFVLITEGITGLITVFFLAVAFLFGQNPFR